MSKKKNCKCSVCKAVKKSGLQVFRYTYDFDEPDGEIMDSWFLSIDKTKKQFRKAIERARKKVDGGDYTSTEAHRILINQMLDADFIPVYDYESHVELIDEKHPPVKGVTFSRDKRFNGA